VELEQRQRHLSSVDLEWCVRLESERAVEHHGRRVAEPHSLVHTFQRDSTIPSDVGGDGRLTVDDGDELLILDRVQPSTAGGLRCRRSFVRASERRHIDSTTNYSEQPSISDSVALSVGDDRSMEHKHLEEEHSRDSRRLVGAVFRCRHTLSDARLSDSGASWLRRARASAAVIDSTTTICAHSCASVRDAFRIVSCECGTTRLVWYRSFD